MISASRSTGCGRTSRSRSPRRAAPARTCRSPRWSISSTRKCRRWAAAAGTRRACWRGSSGRAVDWRRKIVFFEERVLGDGGRVVATPITRVAGIAVIKNPFAGKGYIDDLSSLFDVGAMLGEPIMPDMVRRPPTPATSYGKAAIVGVAGDFEHGGALIHPKLGQPMRAAVGGGGGMISSNVKGPP